MCILQVFFDPSVESESPSTLEQQYPLLVTEGACVRRRCADVLTPNTGADQLFATPLQTKSSRSQATPDSNAPTCISSPLPSSVCYLFIAKYLLPNFVLAVFEIDASICWKI